MNDEVVTRLYRCLVEELRSRGHDEDHPVKVSELYQAIIPYRTVRAALGVELNADYEHALLRLLAGERDLLRLEPEQAREELRREVDAPYPFVGLFRKFSASSVWVSMGKLTERPAPAPGSAPRQEPPVAPSASAAPAVTATSPAPPPPPRAPIEATPLATPPARIAAEAEEVGPVGRRGGPVPARAPAAVQIHREQPSEDPTDRLTHAGSDCVFCGEDLPTGRRIRFCPHCGGDQRLRPCPRCDAVLEREWRYCISCGHEVSKR